MDTHQHSYYDQKRPSHFPLDHQLSQLVGFSGAATRSLQAFDHVGRLRLQSVEDVVVDEDYSDDSHAYGNVYDENQAETVVETKV